MYSINNKYSAIDIRIKCHINTERCDWAFNLFANLVVIFPKGLKHAFLFKLHDNDSARSYSTITKHI